MRILHGVAGEGFGHSSRSYRSGQHLIEAGHEVLFVASGKSLSYLRKHFGEQVTEIFGRRAREKAAGAVHAQEYAAVVADGLASAKTCGFT